jgi:septum formation protein
MPIILASKSPRRQALLARITEDFIVIPSHAEESSTGTPREQVLASARIKAHAVGKTHDGVILGADTVVVLEDQVLGKPKSREMAEHMLRSLSGKTHAVLTGLHLWNTTQDIELEFCAETEVRFRVISEKEIAWYLDSGEYSDKAGAYAIQGKAAVFIEGINGEYTNVMGLPLCELSHLLREIGVTL